MFRLVIVSFMLLVFGCEKEAPAPAPVAAPNKCAISPYVAQLKGRAINLPSSGKFVEESHYVTTEDKFKSRFGTTTLFPFLIAQNMDKHLKRSCKLFKEKVIPHYECDKLYHQPWHQEWTPSEGGHIGQGSVGDVQVEELTPWMEMWLGTMMWAKGKKPKRGEKFLVKHRGKSVVIHMGYETGPGSVYYLGGLVREIHAYLGTGNSSDIEIGYLKDQSLPLGPLDCK